jgi:hypothetical protein
MTRTELKGPTGRRLPIVGAAVLALTVLTLPQAGFGQSSPAPASPAPASPPPASGILADPAFQAAQKRYEALPDAERRAIQEALMWTGDFSGAGSGTYGPLTFRAIQAFQKRAGAPTDGFLGPRERAALEAAANKARGEVRFTRLQDGKAGLQIGVPQGILGKVAPSRMGTRYSAADGSVALETFAQQGTDLPTLFAQLTADQPGRKVTYKVLRPDFFVIAADQDGRRSYTRFGTAPSGLKGFVFTYPVAAAATYDRMSVAIANSFEPEGSASASVAAPAQPPVQAAPPSPQAGQPFATGLVIAAGKVLTVAAVESCADATVSGRPARLERADKPAGLAILDVPGLKGPSPAPSLGARPANGAALLVVGYAPGLPGSGGSATLSVGPGEARVPADTDQLRILAPLQTGGAGTPVFDRGGALVGLVGAMPQEPRLVAGIVPAASYPLIGPAVLGTFAGIKPGAAGPAASLGDVAGRSRDLVAAVHCRK